MAATAAETAAMDMKLELVVLPVTDVERAKEFYAERLAFTLDVDHQADDGRRVVQLTPPGSACSVTFGTGIVDTPPGSVQGLHLVVADIHTAREKLAANGVKIGAVEEHTQPGKPSVFYAFFTDPDGNGWTLQKLPY